MAVSMGDYGGDPALGLRFPYSHVKLLPSLSQWHNSDTGVGTALSVSPTMCCALDSAAYVLFIHHSSLNLMKII